MSTVKMLCMLSLSIIASGCATVPSAKFASFSGATETLDKGVDIAFQQIRAAEIQNTVVSAPAGPITDTTFQPPKFKNASGKLVVPIFDYMDIMEHRIDVIDKYAKALEALAGSGTAEVCDKASNSLASSLNSLSKADHVISVSTGNEIAALADAAGRWATYSERKSGLIDVLTKGQPALAAISQEIVKDVPQLIKYVANDESNLLLYATEVHKTSNTFTAERFNFDCQIAQQIATFDNLKVELQHIQDLAAKLPATNQELLNSVNAEGVKLDNLKSFAESARDLHSFYKTLPTK